MGARMEWSGWIIVNPEGLPLLHTISSLESAAWLLALRGTGPATTRPVSPSLSERGYRAVQVRLQEINRT